MSREIVRKIRDRHLTPEEGEKYAAIRAQIEAEKPEINAQIRSQLEAASAVQRIFEQLQQAREAKGMSLHDLEQLTGIDALALSKLEQGEPDNFTVDTVVRYAQALGKQVAMSLSDAPAS